MTRHIMFAAFQTDRRSNGGIESATQIFEALASDFRWTLLTNRESGHTERWRAGGARIVSVTFEEGAGAGARRLQLGRATVSALLRGWSERPDLLHANDIRGAQILSPVATLTGRPLAFTLRNSKAAGEGYGRHWLRLSPKLAGMVTLSDEMRRHAAGRLGVPAERVVTINSVVDIATFRPREAEERTALRSRLGIARDEVAVGIVAGTLERKRQLEVIRDVLPRLPDYPLRLHLVGDFIPETDFYARRCADAAAAAGLGDRAVFHGYRADVADWLAALDVVLVASRREGLARCMIEAMACGTPVLSFDVCSAREMLEANGAGVVVDQGDYEAFARELAAFARDPERRRAMGRAGRLAAEQRFSVDRAASAWVEFYAGLMESPGK